MRWENRGTWRRRAGLGLTAVLVGYGTVSCGASSSASYELGHYSGQFWSMNTESITLYHYQTEDSRQRLCEVFLLFAQRAQGRERGYENQMVGSFIPIDSPFEVKEVPDEIDAAEFANGCRTGIKEGSEAR